MKKIKIGQGEVSKLELEVFKEIGSPTFERKAFVGVYRLLALSYCGLLKADRKAKKRLLEIYSTIKDYERLPSPEKAISYS